METKTPIDNDVKDDTVTPLSEEAQRRNQLLVRNMEEQLNWEPILEKLAHGEDLTAYWGTAPTGEPHLAYYFPLIKIRDLMEADVTVTILLADVHSYMDKGSTQINGVEQRTKWYEHILKAMLRTIGVDPDDINFQKGSDYQLDKPYCRDMYKLSTVVGLREAKRAASDVVKTSKNPSLSNLMYPLMQCLDETYVGPVDIQIGGRDQRKIFALSLDKIQKIGYKKCSYLLTPFIPGLKKKNAKMSASSDDKICFSDTKETLERKLQSAFCVDGDVDPNTNPIVAMLKFIVFPLFNTFHIERDVQWGGPLTFHSWDEFEQAFINKEVCGADIKPNLVDPLWKLIEPVKHVFTENGIHFQ